MKKGIWISLIIVAVLVSGFFLFVVEPERFDSTKLEQAVNAFESKAQPDASGRARYTFRAPGKVEEEIGYLKGLTDALVENRQTCAQGEEAILSLHRSYEDVNYPSMLSSSGMKPVDPKSPEEAGGNSEQMQNVREVARNLLEAVSDFREECPEESRSLESALDYIFAPPQTGTSPS